MQGGGEVRKGMKSGKGKSKPSLLTDGVVSLEQNLKEETEMVVVRWHVKKTNAQKPVPGLCTKNEHRGHDIKGPSPLTQHPKVKA